VSIDAIVESAWSDYQQAVRDKLSVLVQPSMPIAWFGDLVQAIIRGTSSRNGRELTCGRVEAVARVEAWSETRSSRRDPVDTEGWPSQSSHLLRGPCGTRRAKLRFLNNGIVALQKRDSWVRPTDWIQRIGRRAGERSVAIGL
jgi:hypothetical protein